MVPACQKLEQRSQICLHPSVCHHYDISTVVVQSGPIWEELFPCLQQGAWSLSSSWEARVLS